MMKRGDPLLSAVKETTFTVSWALTLVKDLAMTDVSNTNTGHHDTSPAIQTMCENSFSTGQIERLIIEMNDILCNKFYPTHGSKKAH